MTPLRTLQEAEVIINFLNTTHNVGNYSIQFVDKGNKRVTIASCNYFRKVFTYVKFYAMHLEKEHFVEIILHEIAHALTPGHGHDNYFKHVCRTIGGTPNRCNSFKYLHEHLPQQLKQKINYIYKCPACPHEMHTTKKLKRNYSCPKCNPRRYDPNFMLVLVENKRENKKLDGFTFKKQPERLQGFSLS